MNPSPPSQNPRLKTDPTQEGDAVEERVWTIQVCERCGRLKYGPSVVGAVCRCPNESTIQRHDPNAPRAIAIEVVPLSLLTQALEAMEEHATKLNRSAEECQWGDDFDAEVAAASNRLLLTASALRAQLQTDS